ncbi:MAG: hypothetical protein KKF48_05690, partial [Nanoarchaeota archaeon]|nr:hypothetical protein [Nanoarchaeota archaeon]
MVIRAEKARYKEWILDYTPQSGLAPYQYTSMQAAQQLQQGFTNGLFGVGLAGALGAMGSAFGSAYGRCPYC